MKGRVQVIGGDAARLPLPDASVDLICTSPPYFGVRDYEDDGEPIPGQLGSEAHWSEYLDRLVGWTAEWARVLSPGGSMFVNLGDRYSGRGHGANRGQGTGRGVQGGTGQSQSRPVTEKSLLNLPHRYAIRCTDELGLFERAEIIWCLSGGARVYARLPTGDRPISLNDLTRAYRPENVQLWNGTRWTQVLGWSRNPDGRDGSLDLEFRTGERVACTAAHQWPTQRGVLRADEIRVGDIIQSCRLPEPDPAADPAGLADDDIGWLVGLYLAEGSCSERTLQFAGHVREDARHARLARIAAAYHGRCAIYPTSRNGVTCNVNGAVLVGIIDHYIGLGRTARTKRLRLSAWQRSDRFLASLVEGYLSGDGGYDAKNDRWRLGFTANDDLAADLRTLAARLGAKISLRRRSTIMDGRLFPGWHGEWRWNRSAHWNAKQDGEVVAIRASRARQFWDVGVADEPHLFALASGILTHNCKANGLPESVKDRVRREHEHLFHFTKSQDYYQATDLIREGLLHPGKARTSGKARQAWEWVPGKHGAENPLGRIPGSVWTLPNYQLVAPRYYWRDLTGAVRWLMTDADAWQWVRETGRDRNWLPRSDRTAGLRTAPVHYAAFPPDLVRPVIAGWCPARVCLACGQGRVPVTAYTGQDGRRPGGVNRAARDMYSNLGEGRLRGRAITGEACACTPRTVNGRQAGVPHTEYHLDGWASPPSRPGRVLDPCAGTGTSALVAAMLGMDGLATELSHGYRLLATWRCGDLRERAAALGVPKPRPEPAGQETLELEF